MPLRLRDDDSSSNTTTILAVAAGAVVGFALATIIAKQFGGIDGLSKAIRNGLGGGNRRRNAAAPTADDLEVGDDFDDWDDSEDADDFEDEESEANAFRDMLEERVLDVFQNDPILAERAIDIESVDDRCIELSGSVRTEAEARHAVVVAGGVPDVERVVDHLAVADTARTARRAKRSTPRPIPFDDEARA